MDIFERERQLIDEISTRLPEFAQACKSDADMVLLHQDAFAGDYQEPEYLLLGKAVKFAGLMGKEVRIVGRNRATIDGLPTKAA